MTEVITLQIVSSLDDGMLLSRLVEPLNPLRPHNEVVGKLE